MNFHLNWRFKCFDDGVFLRLTKIFIVVALSIILYAGIFSGFQMVDEFEHLHASWLVSTGKLPYRDFFEHHNPLLWYLFAPLVHFMYDNVFVFYILRGIIFVVSLICLRYLYKIVLFYSSKTSALICVALSLGNIITIYNFYQFRPDNFMNLGFIMGIYYCFLYMKDSKLKNLIFSFLAFFISALFLQKIVLLLFVIEAIFLFLIFKKKINIKDIFIASLPPLFLGFIFFFFLYHKGILPEYIELNYYFNQDMIYYFDRGSFWFHGYFFLGVYGIPFLAILFLFKRQNIYFRIISLIYVAEFLMRAFYFAPHPNYYTLLTLLSGLVLAPFIEFIVKKNKWVGIILFLALYVYLGYLFNMLEASIDKHNSYKHYQMAKYAHQNSSVDDYLMNGYDNIYNIYRNDVSYYWFGLDMLLPLIEQRSGNKVKLDVNHLIYQYRPKFIFAQDYIDLLALRTYGEVRYAQRFIPEFIYTLYKPTPFTYLMELKN